MLVELCFELTQLSLQTMRLSGCVSSSCSDLFDHCYLSVRYGGWLMCACICLIGCAVVEEL